MTNPKTRSPDDAQPRLQADDDPSVADAYGQPGAAALAAVDDPPPQVAADTVALPGSLGHDSAGSMSLHTREALRVFSGRAANTKARIAPLPGGRHYAAAMKTIWYLSGADNPYADWILIRAYDGLVTLRARMAAQTAAREATLAELRRKGLVFDVLASARPLTVALGFRSPYGFAIAETIVEFDYYVRLVQTLVRTDRLSDADGVTDIHALSQGLFGLYHKAMRWERVLLGKALQHLCRADFRPEAGMDARERVAAAAAQLGKLPRDILLGIEQPRHSRRRGHTLAADTALVSQSLPTGAAMTESLGHAVDEDGSAHVALQLLSSFLPVNVSRETMDAGTPSAPAVQ